MAYDCTNMLGKLRQEDSELKASRGFILRLFPIHTCTVKGSGPTNMKTVPLTQPTAAASSTHLVSQPYIQFCTQIGNIFTRCFFPGPDTSWIFALHGKPREHSGMHAPCL